MPTVYGRSNYADPGIALALLPSKSYAQARADKQSELQYMMALGEIQRNKLIEKQAADSNVRQTFAQLKALPIQAPDQQRINLVVDQLRNDLSRKIMDKYDGDIQKYMTYEGENDLQDITTQILNHEVTQKALKNKYAYGVYAKDVSEGKDFTMPVSYTLIDGSKVENVPFAQALQDFNNYKTAELPYAGAFTKAGGAMQFFSKTMHPDPNKRYGVKDELGNRVAPSVTLDEYMDFLMNNEKNPLTREQAAVMAQHEYPLIAGSLKWATDNPLELDRFAFDQARAKDDSAYKWATYGLRKQELEVKKKVGAALSGAMSFSKVFDSQTWTASASGVDYKPTLGQGEKILSAIGVSKGGPVTRVISTKDTSLSKDISNVPSELKEVDESKIYRLSDGRVAFKGKIRMKELDAEKKGAWNDGGYLWFDSRSKKWNSEKKGVDGKDDDVEVEVFIPVDQDAQTRLGINYQTQDASKADAGQFGTDILYDFNEAMSESPDLLDQIQ